jgi:hypothetical protein
VRRVHERFGLLARQLGDARDQLDGQPEALARGTVSMVRN